MSYIGNTPAEKYTSLSKQDLTGDGTAGPYTLDYAVGGNAELEIFVNNVRQEPSSAYSVAGNQLTMTGNVASTDDFYVVFQGKSIGTISPPDGSVTSAKLDTNIAISGNLDVGTIRSTNGTAAMTIDSSGHVLQPAKPAFRAWNNVSDTSIDASTSDIKVNFDTEMFDIGGNFDLANSKFITPVTGLYFLSFAVYLGGASDVTSFSGRLYLDGNRQWPTSANRPSTTFVQGGSTDPQGGSVDTSNWSGVVPLVANEELELYFRAVGDTSVTVQIYGTDFSGYLVG